ncbi:hypothetical protein A2U01_0081439, partial [Trifolium medium]|nr:hypothetical protein [Trifolium medium]
DLGTEYLVHPLVAAEKEKASSDFEPVENGVDEDEGEKDEGIAMMMLRRVGSFFAGELIN